MQLFTTWPAGRRCAAIKWSARRIEIGDIIRAMKQILQSNVEIEKNLFEIIQTIEGKLRVN